MYPDVINPRYYWLITGHVRRVLKRDLLALVTSDTINSYSFIHKRLYI